MIDLSEYLFVIHHAPEQMVSWQLACWLEDLGLWGTGQIKGCDAGDRHIDCQHNEGITRALRTSFGKFVFIESDLRPDIPHSAEFWTATSDVVGCRYPTEQDSAWDNPTWIHAGMYRTTRRVLETVEQPWFEWGYNATRTKTTECLCSTFCRKVLAAGFTIEQAGYAMHEPRQDRGRVNAPVIDRTAETPSIARDTTEEPIQ